MQQNRNFFSFELTEAIDGNWHLSYLRSGIPSGKENILV